MSETFSPRGGTDLRGCSSALGFSCDLPSKPGGDPDARGAKVCFLELRALPRGSLSFGPAQPAVGSAAGHPLWLARVLRGAPGPAVCAAPLGLAATLRWLLGPFWSDEVSLARFSPAPALTSGSRGFSWRSTWAMRVCSRDMHDTRKAATPWSVCSLCWQ